MNIFFIIITGYFFGCIQSAYIIIKSKYGADIRDAGSGNAGTMNVLINYGTREAVLTFLCDIMKTVLCCAVCLYAFPKTEYDVLISAACLGVSLGHEFPFYMKFRGGKGIAVAIGFMLVFDIRILAASLVFALLTALISKRLTVGSIGLSFMMAFCTAMLYPPVTGVLVCVQSFFIIMLHAKGICEKNGRHHEKRKSRK